MILKMGKHNYDLFCLEMNRGIEEHADNSSIKIYNGDIKEFLTYPPNGGLTVEEKQELEKLKGNKVFQLAIRKILADNSSSVLFHILNLIDGTGDPVLGKWEGYGIKLIDFNEDLEDIMEGAYDNLHDGLFSFYRDWKNLRNKDWTLDILEDELKKEKKGKGFFGKIFGK